MNSWKGSLVTITIYEIDRWVFPIYEAKKFLDTDTMSDLFDKYPPLTHQYEIYPYRKEGVLDDDE